jgi:hypothetical protein
VEKLLPDLNLVAQCLEKFYLVFVEELGIPSLKVY